MENFDVIIIGGGASGLFCATQLDKNLKIAIVEKENRIGKKILATGNGRCNLTNLNLSSQYYNCNLNKYFEKFDNQKTLNIFQKMGLLTYSDSEGRVYPISNSANSVLDILRLKIENNKNIKLFLENKIVEIKKTDTYFIVQLENNEIIKSKYLLYSCGGNTLNEINKLHDAFIPFQKSLVSLKTATPNKGLNGVRVDNVKATLQIDNSYYSENGEILFKENAVSGILIFNLSAYMARVNNYRQSIFIDFLPYINITDLETILTQRQQNNLAGNNLLTGIFHSALAKNILEKVNFDTKNAKNIAKIIKNYEISTISPLDNNQVFSGGIQLDSLSDDLESKQTNKLFFAGECINVDGLCGGYNLQWAWTSSAIVANAINKMEKL